MFVVTIFSFDGLDERPKFFERFSDARKYACERAQEAERAEIYELPPEYRPGLHSTLELLNRIPVEIICRKATEKEVLAHQDAVSKAYWDRRHQFSAISQRYFGRARYFKRGP
jgi:hypothetical protein